MADRSYIIELILRARDETAAAIASAMGQMDAFEKKQDEQRAKTDAQTEVNKKLIKSHEDLSTSQNKLAQGYEKIQRAQANYKNTTDQLARSENVYGKSSLGSTEQRAAALRRESEAREAVRRAVEDVARSDQSYARQFSADHLTRYTSLQLENSRLQEQKRLVEDLSSEYDRLVQSVARAEQRQATTRVPFSQLGQRSEVRADLQLDTARARAKLDEFLASERSKRLDIDVDILDRDIAKARAKLNAGLGGGGRGGGRGGGSGGVLADPGSGGEGGLGGLLSNLQAAQDEFSNLDTSTKGFNSSIRNAFGFAVVALIQPFMALLVGMASTMGAVASAAMAAGTAIGTTFASSMAEGIPVMGLFAAAMQRLTTIFSYVTTIGQQAQAQFVARYQFLQQAAMGINPITIAEHSYSDALFQSQQAVRQVGVAELGLLSARQQATRQLQQLIFQEENAKLAAQSSSLAITDAQKALQQAIATGGDVQAAQLQLAQAHVQHQQAVVSAQQAISDAAPGSIARQNIQQTVQQAQVGVQQAQRAVVDSQYQLAQARAAIIQAQQAARGYNLGTAAQLAWLRSQMTDTEKALAGNILRIYQMFQGVHGYMRPITDAILGAFIPLTGQIIKTLQDPRIFSALLSLGRQMGSAIRTVTDAVFSPQSINSFLAILHAAAQNMAPLATSIANIFKGVQAIIVAAIPYVHQFAGFITGITQQFARWAQSTSGQNFIKQFFDVAYRSLESFITLGEAVVKLFAAIIGPGGGAKAGIGVIQDLTRWVNNATNSVLNHGKVWKDLQELWSTVQPTLHALSTILGAIVHAFIEIGTSPQGKKSLQDMADIVARILIPAFVKFVQDMGKVTGAITGFLDKHPALEKFLTDLLAAVATISVGGNAIGLLFGPLSQVVGLIRTLATLLPEIDLAEVFGDPVVLAVAAVAAAIVGISAATGNLHKLIQEVESPFKALWASVKPEIQGLGDAFKNFLNAVLAPFGIHFKTAFSAMHDVVKIFLDWFGLAFRGAFLPIETILSVLLRAFQSMFNALASDIRGAEKVFKGVFDIIKGIVTLNGKEIIKGFKEIGSGIATGLWGGIKAIGDFFINIFKDAVKNVERFLGISSPSSLFMRIGKDILDGIWNGISELPNLFLDLGKKLVDALINGIKSLAGKVGKAVEDLIPAPVRNIIGAVGHGIESAASTVGHGIASGASAVAHFFGFAEGGPVPGFGGGDKWPRMLEGGEHVLTKEEVQRAGGHGPIFALRRALGGGNQGGPYGYAQGGQVGASTSSANLNIFSLGYQNSQGQTTQGVTGIMGSILANLMDFIAQSTKDWTNYWQNFNKLTGNQISQQQNQWTNSFSYLTKQIGNFWDNIINKSRQQLTEFVNLFKSAFNSFDTDTFNAFWYIVHSANQALSGFQAKPVNVRLAAPPKFDSGGFLGQMGERGPDAVHAVLGRGEAVLNWAHQKVVDPALKAYYGFGLNKLFDKVRGQHAAGGARGMAQGGYAGYSLPLPRRFMGGTWSPDEGVDINGGTSTIANAPLYAVGDGIIIREGLSGFGPNAPVLLITSGPLKGRAVYYGHAGADTVPVGTRVRAGQQISRVGAGIVGLSTGPHLEIGFADPRSGDPIGPATAGSMVTFLHQLLGGAGVQGINVPGGGIGGSGGATWADIAMQKVSGIGVLANLLKAGIKTVTNAANAFGTAAAGAVGGVGSAVGSNWSGPWVSVMAQIAKKFGWSLPDWKWIVNAESGGNPAAVNTSSGAFGLGQFLGATAQAYAKFGALSKNPVKQIEAMAQYILDRYKNPTVAKAFHIAHNWYDKGGFVGAARPIMAHVGEWVVNQAQQSKLANWLGVGRNSLKSALGFSGGPDSFAGGGEVGETTSKGVYTPPTVSVDTPGFNQQAISIYNRAQAIIVAKIEDNGKRVTKGLQQFLANFSQVGGDNGIFALAAQAIQDYVNQQSSVVQLAAAGYRVVNNAVHRLVSGPQTAVQAAQRDLQSTSSEIAMMVTNQNQLVTALRRVQTQIRHFGPVTSKNLSQYQQLTGARQTLINDLHTADQNLAQAYSDQYTKAVAVVQAQNAAALRGSGTLSGSEIGSLGTFAQGGGAGTLQSSFNNLRGVMAKVGPQVANGLATMAQQVAQAFGNTSQLIGPNGIDQSVLSSARAVQSTLQQQYADAAKRAQRDPRWQSVADDLLSQLESATEAVAQAQAQALTDAISSQDTQTQMQQAGFSMWQTIMQTVGQMSSAFGSPSGQFSALSGQIGLSRANAQSIQGQLNAYQALYQQAAAQGNESAMNQLTQTMDQLNTTMYQANMQTQQLITSYYQLSATIASSISQSQGGLFQSAQSIYQTIGTITGSQMLPQLIASALSQQGGLVGQGQNAIQNILGVLGGSQGAAFGAATPTANNWLSQALQAYQAAGTPGTPTYGAGFASWLSQNAVGLSQFQSGLPQDQQTLFNNLIQSLVDNVTALTQNTQQLQQLNATTNQQQFTSSAWSMFRDAVFNGLGGLLPQYALQVPAMDTGGFLQSSGLFYGHRGEGIIPASVMRGEVATGPKIGELHNHFEQPMEVADPVYLSNRIAWAVNHDPNSR